MSAPADKRARATMTMKAKYAFRALAYLGAAPAGRPSQLVEIATDEQIPRKFLQLILMELRRHGFVRSRRGRTGGYSLGLPAVEISLAAVMRAFETPLAPLACLNHTAPTRCAGCADENTCKVRLLLMQVYEPSARLLENMTVADLLTHAEKGRG